MNEQMEIYISTSCGTVLIFSLNIVFMSYLDIFLLLYAVQHP